MMVIIILIIILVSFGSAGGTPSGRQFGSAIAGMPSCVPGPYVTYYNIISYAVT